MMGSVLEMGLDMNPPCATKTIRGFLSQLSVIGDSSKRLLKIEGFLKCLEEERKKINAFKRELPFCVLLMNDAIEIVKEEQNQCRSSAVLEARPILEEFLPTKDKVEEQDEESEVQKDRMDKMNWMRSAQLWSDSTENENYRDEISAHHDQKEISEESDLRVFGNQISEEAFTPVKGLSGFSEMDENGVFHPISALSLRSTSIKNSNSSLNSKNSSRTSALSSATNIQSNSQQQQAARKSRRCWSPELHKRFVHALDQLGGSQVATPKQIRELMKIDGLTNDEVKSHLQKYRLHVRRVSPLMTAGESQEFILMERLRTLDQHYQTSKQSPSQSESPQGPLQLSRACRGISDNGGCENEEEDRRTESYSWNGYQTRSWGDGIATN